MTNNNPNNNPSPKQQRNPLVVAFLVLLIVGIGAFVFSEYSSLDKAGRRYTDEYKKITK